MPALADAQLRLDLPSSEYHRTEHALDPIDAALAYHDGDYRAAIDCLLKDVVFLKEELFIAERMLSKGMGRSWAPRYEREREG